MRVFYLLFALCWVSAIPLFSQQTLAPAERQYLDSLEQRYAGLDNPCEKATLLMDYVEVVYKADRDTVLDLCHEAIALVGDNSDTLCLRAIATAYNNMGVIYDDHGQIMKSIKAYEASILIFERINDLKGIATSYTNIGYIYKNINEMEQCYAYNRKALQYRFKLGDKRDISNSLNNLGYLSSRLGKPDSALYYYRKSFNLRKEINYERGMAVSMNNIGAIHEDQGKLDSALYYFKGALVHHRASNTSITNAMINLAEAYYHMGDYHLAQRYADSAVLLSEQEQIPERLRLAAQISYMVYEKLDNIDKAYYYHKLEQRLADSIAGQKLHDELIREEARFRFLREHIRDSIAFAQRQQAIDKVHTTEIEAEQQKSFYELLGIIFLIVVVILLVIAYRMKRKSGLTLNNKNQQLMARNKEITNSINYAKKIQKSALMYDKAGISNCYEHFILYIPKEIVSGDFYWFHQKEDVTYIAVADCSGHGVPAGFLSMLGFRLLNEVMAQYDLPSPALILNELSARFTDALNQRGEVGDSFDGMDIAIVKLKEGTSSMQWSAANSQLILAQKDGTCTLLKPTTTGSIGYYQQGNHFEDVSTEIGKGDMVYLFSDGYVDQFGGADQKKLGYNTLRAYIESIYALPLKEQKDRLEKHFKEWKGEEEQLDDICVLGIRFTGSC